MLKNLFNTKAREEAKQKETEEWTTKKRTELLERIEESKELLKDNNYMYAVLDSNKYWLNTGGGPLSELTDVVKLYIKNGFIIFSHSYPRCSKDQQIKNEINWNLPTEEYRLQRISTEYYKNLIESKPKE